MVLKRFFRCIWVSIVMVAAACGGTDSSPPVPAPDSTQMASPVAEAVENARAALLIDLTDTRAWGEFGMVLAAHGFVEESVICYRQAASLDPEEAKWPYLEALALRDSLPDAAAAAFLRAVACDPIHPVIWYSAGTAAIDQGNFEEARGCFERTRELAPESPFAHYGLGRVAVLEGSLDEARLFLERAVEVRWKFRQGHLLLAEVLQRSGDQQQAARHRMIAGNSIDLDPSDPFFSEVVAHGIGAEWSKSRGIALLAQGQLGAAETEFRNAVEQAPHDATHQVNLGRVIAAQGRVEEALAAFEAAQFINPHLLATHINLAMVLHRSGDAEGARRQLEEVVRLDPLADPEAVQAHCGLASLDLDNGDSNAAQVHLLEALSINPGDPEALILSSRLAAASGKFGEAAELVGRAVDIDPTRSAAALELAEVLVRAGRHRECIDLLRRVVAGDPDDHRATLLLAWELATAPEESDRDGAAAVVLARAVYERQPGNVTAADVLAVALAETGDFASAVVVAEAAVVAARENGNPAMAQTVETRLSLYRNGRSFRK